MIGFCIGLVLVGDAQALEESYWQRWGGPNANQSTTSSDWETDWEKQPPKEVWSVEIGTGFSGITLFKQNLFVAGRAGDADAIYCLEKDTGKEIWRHIYETPLANKQHEGGPGSTPTHHRGLVYMLSRNGHAHCLDAKDGSVVWEANLLELTGGERPWWGCTSSPLVIDDKVIFDAGSLIALDRKSGKEIWKTEKHRSGYGSVMAYKNGKHVVALSNDALLIVEQASGKIVAQTAWITDHPTNATTPVLIDNDKFFVSTGYKRGCGMFQFADEKLAEIYVSRHMSNHMANSVLHNGFFYGINGNSHIRRICALVCINAETGEKVWGERGFGCGSVVLAGDHLLILSDQGDLVCAEASADGFIQTGKVKVLDGKCWTAPTFLENRIYCRNAEGDLVCWEMSSK